MAKSKCELENTVDMVFKEELIQKCIQHDELTNEYPYDELVEDYRVFETTEIDFDYNISKYNGIEIDLENYIHYKFEETKELSRSTYLFIRSVINMTLINKYSTYKDPEKYKKYNEAYSNMVEYFQEQKS
ncbi:MAG: hypothetical protein WBG69_11665 [Arcobacteraceae bacterium]